MKRFLKYAITAFVIVALAASIAACNNVEFLFSCDIEDSATVILPEYSFNVSAAYGGEECDVSVSLNGVLTAGGGSGKYTVQLDKGENLIKITATRSKFSETRIYHVIYRADFEISTDIDEAAIINESISFTAGATFNDLPCALIAEIGGEELEGKEGVFTARLNEGENIISLIARYGDLTERIERRHRRHIESPYKFQEYQGAAASHRQRPAEPDQRAQNQASFPTSLDQPKKGQEALQRFLLLLDTDAAVPVQRVKESESSAHFLRR